MGIALEPAPRRGPQAGWTSAGVARTAVAAPSAADHPTTLAGTTQAFEMAGQQCWSIPGAVATPTLRHHPAGHHDLHLRRRAGNRTKPPAAGTATTGTFDQANPLTATTGSPQ